MPARQSPPGSPRSSDSQASAEPAAPPHVQFKPGLANETPQELGPLLAEEAIDVNNIDVPDFDTLQTALNRAVERHNMARFTPVGETRQRAVVTLWLATEAIIDGDTKLGAAILAQVQPDSPDGTVATVASCIGVAILLPRKGILMFRPAHPPSSSVDPGLAVLNPTG